MLYIRVNTNLNIGDKKNMIKRYIRKSEIEDQDNTHILLVTGELLKKSDCQFFVPIINRRVSGLSVNVHLNGGMSAPARLYNYRPYTY